MRADGVSTGDRLVPVGAFIVGVQKGATSSLYWMLWQHPEVCDAPRKEWHYFDNDRRDWDDLDYSDYVTTARSEPERLAIDATPSYLFWPRAMARLGRYAPSARLVATFRDPIERAFSHWMMEAGRDRSFPDFGRFVSRGPRWDLISDDGPLLMGGRRRASIVERGLYGFQLDRGFQHVPREHWLLLDFDEVVADPAAAAESVAEFYGLSPFPDTPAAEVRMAAPRQLRRTGPTEGDIEKLAGHFAEDLVRFAELSGMPVAHWSTAQILAGTLAPADLAERLSARLRR